MKALTIDDLRKLMDYEQVVDLQDDTAQVMTHEGDKVYLGRYDQNIIYDENLAF